MARSLLYDIVPVKVYASATGTRHFKRSRLIVRLIRELQSGEKISEVFHWTNQLMCIAEVEVRGVWSC